MNFCPTETYDSHHADPMPGSAPLPVAVSADALRQRALRLLARREHSRAELARKLSSGWESGEVDSEAVAALLDRFEELGLLSDARFAESFVRSRAGRFGAARLRYDLANKGVAGDLVEQSLATLAENEGSEELDRAREVWRRKFDGPPADAREYGRQARFLQGRGFSTDVVRRVLKASQS